MSLVRWDRTLGSERALQSARSYDPSQEDLPSLRLSESGTSIPLRVLSSPSSSPFLLIHNATPLCHTTGPRSCEVACIASFPTCRRRTASPGMLPPPVSLHLCLALIDTNAVRFLPLCFLSFLLIALIRARFKHLTRLSFIVSRLTPYHLQSTFPCS